MAIMLGLSGVSAALFEERMTGNYRLFSSALQASEVGVKDMIGFVRDNYGPSSPPNCSVDGTILDDPDSVSYSSSGGLDRDYNTKLVCEDGEVVGYSLGRVYRDAETLSAREIRVVLIPPGENEIEGMLADGN
ncbi:hypothetical protein, partial [Staphylococcus aureus]|uniref:pilus assembly PilX family protein n=1 Tax=Staphylococcus aureus TaxID=1280 RepID=UPI00301C777E